MIGKGDQGPGAHPRRTASARKPKPAFPAPLPLQPMHIAQAPRKESMSRTAAPLSHHPLRHVAPVFSYFERVDGAQIATGFADFSVSWNGAARED
jgi:hypothetical protein